MLPLALVVLSQTVNPYAGVTLKPGLPGLDATAAGRIGARVGSADAGRAAPKAPLTATDFKPAGPRTGAQLVVAQSKLPKEQAAALIEGLNAGIDSFEQQTRKYNVAYAVAFLLVSALQVATDRELADSEMYALAQAVNDELASSAAFKKLSAAQKQLLYETAIVLGALIGGISAEAAESHDAALKSQARQMAAQALSVFRP